MDAVRILELSAKAGRAYVCAIRQAYRDVIHADDLLADGYEKLAADPEFQADMAARRRERLVDRDAKAEEPQSDYYASRLGVAEEGGEALEPQPQCECWWVDEKLWTTHYDAAEPGSQMEWNPDCPEHPPAAMESDGPDAAKPVGGAFVHVCNSGSPSFATDLLEALKATSATLAFDAEYCSVHNQSTVRVAGLDVTRASLGDLGDSLQRITDAEQSAFRSGGQTYETGPRPRISTPPVPSSSAGRGVGSPGVSAGAEEPAPPGKRTTPGEFAAVAVREVLAAHHPWEGAGGIECSPESADFEHPYSADHLLHFADKHDWREHVSEEVARRIDAAVGVTPTPKPAAVEAASTFEQHRKGEKRAPS